MSAYPYEFEHYAGYDGKLKKIEKLIHLPYVGKNYRHGNTRVLVFGDNWPENPSTMEERNSEPDLYTASRSEYTWKKEAYTAAWRNFLISYSNLKSDYNPNGDIIELLPVISTVEQIAFKNFIDGVVPSNKQSQVHIGRERFEHSCRVNIRLLEILDPTHIVCWGGSTFEKVKYILNGKNRHLQDSGKKGFAYMPMPHDMPKYHVLKVSHPGWPGFGRYKADTHKIYRKFLASSIFDNKQSIFS